MHANSGISRRDCAGAQFQIRLLSIAIGEILFK